MVKLAVITNAILDYRRPLFAELQNEAGIQLQIFLSESNLQKKSAETLPLKYSKSLHLSWTTSHHGGVTRQRQNLPIPLLLARDIAGFSPDLIISGEFGVRSLIAFSMARLLRVPFVIWTEETTLAAQGKSKLQLLIRRFLIPMTDAFLALGQPACDYLRTYGVPERNIYRGAQAVDNLMWSNAAASADRIQIRREYGLTGTVFLAVGRLVALKGFDRLLKAWAELPEILKLNNTLMIVGDGEENNPLQSLACKLSLSRVIFVGHRSTAELAGIYAAGDVFVLPSLIDVWGLVVNEAMACGLPALVSHYAGSGPGLVDGSGAGEVFDPFDQKGFTELLVRWCGSAGHVPRQLPQQVVNRVTFAETVSAIRRLISDKTRRKGIA